jgi:hypothetical protein
MDSLMSRRRSLLLRKMRAAGRAVPAGRLRGAGDGAALCAGGVHLPVVAVLRWGCSASSSSHERSRGRYRRWQFAAWGASLLACALRGGDSCENALTSPLRGERRAQAVVIDGSSSMTSRRRETTSARGSKRRRADRGGPRGGGLQRDRAGAVPDPLVPSPVTDA